jgi:2-polyprenyl-6-methoxyphenol hydroxylase-like FAD-dependent oxidoreductase
MMVLIVGAGIGGLCLAQGLRKSGIDVAVYERDADPLARAQGYRFSVRDEAVAALHECLPPDLYSLFESTSGKADTQFRLFANETDALAELHTTRHETGGDHVVDRATLREIALRGLDVRFGKKFTHYQLQPDGVVAYFADGTKSAADVLVGADGASSHVRRQLLPDVSLVDTGARWLFGRTPGLPSNSVPRRLLTVRSGQGVFFLAEGPDYLMWSLVGAPGAFGHPDVYLAGLNAVELHEVAMKVTAERYPLLHFVVRDANPADSAYVSIRATTPITPWETGPVTLLGDAAHAMPVNGNGANCALRDAALLRRALAGEMSVADYEAEMLRNADVVRAELERFVRR